MNIKHITSAVLGATVALAIAAAPVLAQLFTVTSNNLNVRTGPGRNYSVTYVLRKGDVVEVIRRRGNWAFIVGARGGEGWVRSRHLSSSNTSPPSGGNNPNSIYKGNGTIDNSRYKGRGDAQLVISGNNRRASLHLGNVGNDGRISIEYIGTVRSNFEGDIQFQISQFRSSEMGYRTVNASGTCDVRVSDRNIRQSDCTARGSGIDHGTTNFKAR
ncbi:MAG: SH3 domain-containing protein [Cyanosarcina radialis HA8281-LM2]|jgi:uncharacterized protein YgiM (DUF1202 family)|nr:SH3 domain-containing protein [Cyanosarcina radialis HA8281-LM2]